MDWLLENWLLRMIILPVADILLLAFIFYKAYTIFLQTRAIQLVGGTVFIAGLYAVSFVLKLETVLWLLNFLAPIFVTALAIIFQPELRKFFTQLGQRRFFSLKDPPQSLDLQEAVKASEVLSSMNRGALIVFVRNVGQKNIIETGSLLNADLKASLIISIFGYDTPLHDGAIIIENGRIIAGGAFLPLSAQQDIRRSFGTRHRAALGLTEESDAVVLVVSEETGAVSLAYDASLYYDLAIEEVRERLQELLNLEQEFAQ